MSDDQAIIRRVLEGDVEAFRAIVERYHAPIYRVTRSLVGPADADDLTQDVLVAAFENLDRYDSRRAPLAALLFAIARNRCRNAIRRRKPRSGDTVIEPCDADTPDAAAQRREWRARFDAALAALPAEQRTAFVLAELEDLSYEEIARIENVSLGTVKSRIYRAKSKLQRILESAEQER